MGLSFSGSFNTGEISGTIIAALNKTVGHFLKTHGFSSGAGGNLEVTLHQQRANVASPSSSSSSSSQLVLSAKDALLPGTLLQKMTTHNAAYILKQPNLSLNCC